MTKNAFLLWDEDPEVVEKDYPNFSAWYMHYVEGGKRIPPMEVEWVTEPGENNLDRSTTMVYGNESTLKFYYHHLCVVATLDPKAMANLAKEAAKAGTDEGKA